MHEAALVVIAKVTSMVRVVLFVGGDDHGQLLLCQPFSLMVVQLVRAKGPTLTVASRPQVVPIRSWSGDHGSVLATTL